VAGVVADGASRRQKRGPEGAERVGQWDLLGDIGCKYK